MDTTKPRVAIYYWVIPATGFRNDGPPLFLNFAFRRILNGVSTVDELNKDIVSHEGNVAHLWPTKGVKSHGHFDLHLLVDHGEDGLPVPKDFEYPHPNAYWVSDAHIDDTGYKYRLETARKFDKVFVCQKRALERFKEDGIDPAKLVFLPHAVDPWVYKPYPVTEKWKWAFIGHLNSGKRIALIDRFCKEFPLGEHGYLGTRMGHIKGHNVMEDAAMKFCRAKIVINDSINEDINMRTFESMACKRLLLTEYIPTLQDLFIHGKHLIMFRSFDDAIEKAHALLNDDEMRTQIAEAGYNEVISNHTYDHRALTILKETLNYEPKGVLQPC